MWWRSLLWNLCTLTLDNVSFSLPALQPVATRLQCLELADSRLRGSADGFLTADWTALHSLSLGGCLVEDDDLTALDLPALEFLGIAGFGHRGGVLQLDQLCCPQMSSLEFQLESRLARASEGDRQCCSLLDLPQSAVLTLTHDSDQPTMDLSLPASCLTHLTVQESSDGDLLYLNWVLLEAAKCIRGGAQLRSLTCANTVPSSHPAWVPWGASSVAYYRDLGEQLSSLKDLFVSGRGGTLLSAIGAVACSAASLTHLEFDIKEVMNGMELELPPVSSASLESVVGRYNLTGRMLPPPPVIMTFLCGCPRLREVRVQFSSTPKEGTSVRIRCRCNSPWCIAPFEKRGEFVDGSPSDMHAGLEEVGVRFMPRPVSPQGVQA